MKAALLICALLVACKSQKQKDPPKPTPGTGSAVVAPITNNQVPRMDWNRLAVRLNLPLYWIDDKDNDKIVDPDEVATLMFYSATPPSLEEANKQILAASKAPPP